MYRMIYKSRAGDRISREMVRGILHESTEQNNARGITGALLATGTHFLQVLEGGFQELNETFMCIARDPRHEKLEIISFGPAHSRLFEGWAMRGIGVFDLNTDLEKDLMEKYGSEEGSVCFPEEEWAALALVNDVRMMSYSPGSCEG